MIGKQVSEFKQPVVNGSIQHNRKADKSSESRGFVRVGPGQHAKDFGPLYETALRGIETYLILDSKKCIAN